MVYEYRSL
ncbi:26716150-8238-4404-965a-e8b9e9843c4f [Thermothielavioides terrestris]|uniref:26716150-8238-4404-965a-e8b9e9843c4f n=1 Tax=Thermothielavioides terrestris TaxID=2587410 RepID=A0A446BQE1_9PEZI|nr:26716150-8238-4404-965a-e8b9e9843c4f [Thermothielavioides terrestris]